MSSPPSSVPPYIIKLPGQPTVNTVTVKSIHRLSRHISLDYCANFRTQTTNRLMHSSFCSRHMHFLQRCVGTHTHTQNVAAVTSTPDSYSGGPGRSRPEAGYPDRGFSRSSSIPPGKCHWRNFN
jgi:hypothetical protein